MLGRLQLQQLLMLLFLNLNQSLALTASAQTTHEVDLADPKYILTIVSGSDANSTTRAKEVVRRAKSEGIFKVDWEKNSSIDRVIGVFDGSFAVQARGKTTILPIVETIAAQQIIAFFDKEKSSLETDDLVEICELLPWDTSLFPKRVEFYRSFEDPARLSSFSCIVTDEPGYLAFANELEKQTGKIRYIASAKLKDKGSESPVILMALGIQDGKEKLEPQALEFPGTQPSRIVVVGSNLLLLFTKEKNSSSEAYLSSWLDGLESKNQNEKELKNKMNEKKENVLSMNRTFAIDRRKFGG